MAKWTIGKGIDNYIKNLQDLEFGSEEMAKQAVYEGAKIVTDAVRASIEALPVGPPREGKVTQKQKQGLLDAEGDDKGLEDPGQKPVRQMRCRSVRVSV